MVVLISTIIAATNYLQGTIKASTSHSQKLKLSFESGKLDIQPFSRQNSMNLQKLHRKLP
jgi:hypothetical protein